MATLKTVTKQFGSAYKKATEFNTKKDKLKGLLFEAFDKELEKKTRRQLLVTCTDPNPQEWVTKNFPGWILTDVHGDQLAIEEDPKFMKFSYLNPDTQMVFGRTVVDPGPSLDDERLREEDPEFWESISEWPEPWYAFICDFAWDYCMRANADLIKTTFSHEDLYSVFESELDQYLELNGMQRTLKNPDDWTEAQFKKVQDYMVPGKLSVRLVAPRPANEDELAELEQ